MDKTSPMKSKPLVDVTCKLGTKGCFEDGRCHAIGNCENKIVTNADRIRAMSDEELADILWKTGRNYRAVCADPVVDYNEHRDHLIAWLQKPAEGE